MSFRLRLRDCSSFFRANMRSKSDSASSIPPIIPSSESSLSCCSLTISSNCLFSWSLPTSPSCTSSFFFSFSSSCSESDNSCLVRFFLVSSVSSSESDNTLFRFLTIPSESLLGLLDFLDPERDLDLDLDRDLEREECLDLAADPDLERDLECDLDLDLDLECDRDLERDFDLDPDLDLEREPERDLEPDFDLERDRDLDLDADFLEPERDREREALEPERDLDLDLLERELYLDLEREFFLECAGDTEPLRDPDTDLDLHLEPDFCDLDRDLEREPFLEPDKDLDFERDKARPSCNGDLDCFLDPEADLDLDLDFLSTELERDLERELFLKSGEPSLEPFTERDFDFDRDSLAVIGDRFGDAEGEREPFLDPDGDLDLEPALTSFGLADLDLERDLVWEDLGVPDREREWIDVFGEPERDRENDLERDRDLEIAWGEGDLDDDRKFVLGESHFETSGFIEFDLDLERELFLDAARELLDEEWEELRDLEPDFAEWCECAGDCEPFLALVSLGSGEWDLERDLDRDVLFLFLAGETDLFGEGDLEGDLE